VVGDGQGVTVAAVAELEFALEVGAPQIVGMASRRQGRALGPVAPQAGVFDQTMAIQHRMHGTLGGHPDVAVQLSNQKLPDLAGPPMGLPFFSRTIRRSTGSGSWLIARQWREPGH